MSNLKITNKELQILSDIEVPEFPKYATQIINLANQNSQGTRSNIVGQQSELIQEFPGNTQVEWAEWYEVQFPDAISKSTDKIYQGVQNLREAIQHIDKSMVEKWVRDLILSKTYIGLRFQQSILKKLSEVKGTTYRLATPEEESQGIDGFVGEVAVSIKPDSYQTAKSHLPEQITASLVYYTKTRDGITIEYDF
jgi:uncharacterized protein YukE